MKLLAVGGGSGGHVTPVAAVIKQLHESDADLSVKFVCDKAFEAQSRGIMAALPVPVEVVTIAAGKFRRYQHLTKLQHLTVPGVVFGNLRDISRIIHGFFQSLGILIRHRPDVVFAKGGYVCLPMGIAAWLLRVPLVIHDSDARPGLTNRILARFARTIATGSPLENYQYDAAKAHYIGVPIGNDFVPVSSEKQQKLKQQLGVDPQAMLVVATGGGLGSKVINDAMLVAAPQLAEQGIVIYDVAGKQHYATVRDKATELTNVIATEFVYSGMASVLGAADVVVSRASATFLQELAGLAKPVVAVPARQLGDQIKNAAVYHDAQAAIVLDDAALAAGKLSSVLIELCRDKSARAKLASNLHTFARPDAARDLADLIMGAAKSS